ncbi:EcoRII N-terminal effector-binding domain-containing protein [Lactobacillus delbrueckii subsp. bulgaricus]
MIRTFDNDIVDKAIDAVMKGRMSYCKFLSANDSGETQSHQSGILISKSAKPMLNVYWSDEEMNNSRILKKKVVKFVGKMITGPIVRLLGTVAKMNYE